MPDDAGGVHAMPDRVCFQMMSDPDSVRATLREAMETGPVARLSVEDRSTAEIVLAEVLNNIVEHAYADGLGSIRLCLSLSAGRLNCRIEDEGRPMPGGQPPAGRAPDPADLPEGGFGWHLIRSLSQGLTYVRTGQINQLTFSLPAEQSLV